MKLTFKSGRSQTLQRGQTEILVHFYDIKELPSIIEVCYRDIPVLMARAFKIRKIERTTRAGDTIIYMYASPRDIYMRLRNRGHEMPYIELL